jgi:hypothetical protein
LTFLLPTDFADGLTIMMYVSVQNVCNFCAAGNCLGLVTSRCPGVAISHHWKRSSESTLRLSKSLRPVIQGFASELTELLLVHFSFAYYDLNLTAPSSWHHVNSTISEHLAYQNRSKSKRLGKLDSEDKQIRNMRHNVTRCKYSLVNA